MLKAQHIMGQDQAASAMAREPAVSAAGYVVADDMFLEYVAKIEKLTYVSLTCRCRRHILYMCRKP
jgi:hypothetical protein